MLHRQADHVQSRDMKRLMAENKTQQTMLLTNEKNESTLFSSISLITRLFLLQSEEKTFQMWILDRFWAGGLSTLLLWKRHFMQIKVWCTNCSRGSPPRLNQDRGIRWHSIVLVMSPYLLQISFPVHAGAELWFVHLHFSNHNNYAHKAS